jgi:hypothetical protein
MPTVPPRYIFNVTDFGDVDPDRIEEAAAEVAEFVYGEVLSKMSEGESPVEGESWEQLSEAYAEEFHGGDRTPRLELTGDMLDAFKVEPKANGEVDIFLTGGLSNDKASGHNQFPGGEHDSLPKRRFIPFGGEGQEFTQDIQAGIRDIVAQYARAEEFEETDVDEFDDLDAEQERVARDILKSFEDFFPDE